MAIELFSGLIDEAGLPEQSSRASPLTGDKSCAQGRGWTAENK